MPGEVIGFVWPSLNELIRNITCISLLLLAVSCSQPAQPDSPTETVMVDSLFSMALPKTLRKTSTMHDAAPLQYYDPARQLYVLGIEDPKDRLMALRRGSLRLDMYFRFVENTVFELADSVQSECRLSLKSEGYQLEATDYFARMPHADGKIYDLYYRIAVFETDTHFFQWIVWMPYATACDHLPQVDEMMRSFRPLVVLERKEAI